MPPLDQAREDRGRLATDQCRARENQVRPRVCTYGNPNAKRKVVLFGDSHALQWGPAIVPLAQRRGWKLYTLLRAGCPIANVVTEKNCAGWRGRALSRIERIRPQHIIISTSIGNRYRLKHQGRDMTRKESEPRLRSGMARTIQRLKRIGSLDPGKHKIKLIRDQVMAPFLPSACLRRNNGQASKCSWRNQRRWAPGFDWAAAKRTGILPAIDPTKALCGPKWCSPTQGRILKYRDTDHITATYARTLIGWFGKRLGIPCDSC